MRKFAVLQDTEGSRVPASLPLIVDSHVHVFPDPVFKAVREWFAGNMWQIRYRLSSREVIEYLLSRGVANIVAHQYAHKSGISRNLNGYMAGLCGEFPGRITGMATVFPGDRDNPAILSEAFGMGLAGVKLHAHVQCFDMNSPDLDVIYAHCSAEKKPVMMHVGREPSSPSYKCDPHALCSAEKLERVVRDYPHLRICVPHLGYDEFDAYRSLIEKYDNLWLDTTMVLTDYLKGELPLRLQDMRPDRIMYGSDFPNIPYAWDHELKWIVEKNFPDEFLKAVLGENAKKFYGIG